MTTAVHIPDIFEAMLPDIQAEYEWRRKLVQPDYTGPFNVEFNKGHYVEVTNDLKAKEKTQTATDKRFPLIWFVYDFTEQINRVPGKYARVELEFILAAQTLPTYSITERDEKVFKPVLYPLMEAFFYAISQNSALNAPSLNTLRFEKTNRPYWGLQLSGNNTKNFFDDHVDAIQIKRLSLNIEIPCIT